ncbi:hypothetical protein ACIGKR_32410 [Rhodococcus qingshengii]|uniref:hypothetical protein n=1 Tax=Rhodococcus qingshengii TaxID=334542 RepID=UPI0037CA71B0
MRDAKITQTIQGAKQIQRLIITHPLATRSTPRRRRRQTATDTGRGTMTETSRNLAMTGTR